MQTDQDLYAVLGVAPSATHAEVRAAYRRIMRDNHPDIVGDDTAAAERAVEANTAWALLRDPSRRASYDRERAAAAAPGPARAGDGGVVIGAGAPSWGPGGVRPVTAQQMRDAAAAQSAYSRQRAETREAFSAASLRIGVAILLLGIAVLALVATS